MRRVLSFFVLLMMLTSIVCTAAWVYPEYTGENKNAVTVNERINIVFDNSGHEYVKSMLTNTLIAASAAENTDIWIYPIAGSNEPIKVEPTKEFVEKNFAKYTKSSNEFKPENIVEKAVADLKNDTTVSNKRFILYVDDATYQVRGEYNYNRLDSYMTDNPEIIFSTFDSAGHVDYNSNYNSKSNYDYMLNKNLYEFLLVKNGYSECEVIHSEESSVITIEKNKANNNLFVLATNEYDGWSYQEGDVYLSGCAMDAETYKSYLSKSKVKGVALSYNHVVADFGNKGGNFASALYTLDGDVVNPQTEAVCIPVKSALKVTVYHRETKGAGVCSADTTYKTTQDKDIVNVYAPEEGEEENGGLGILAKEDKEALDEVWDYAQEENGIKKFFKGAKMIIGAILRSIFNLLKILLVVGIIVCIASGKVRSYLQLKILATKLGPAYEKLIVKIKTMMKDISNAGRKIKGTTDLNGKYIFISKASADMIAPNNRIELLVCELEKRGIQCWLSEKGIKPGQNYNLILPEAIRKCSLFLLFVSPMSVKSSEVVSEIGTAKEYKKDIIPVQIEPFDLFKQFPDWAYMLKQYQKTDLFHSKPDEIKALADNIEQIFNEIK